MADPTAIFSIHDDKDRQIHDTLQEVYIALKEKGYNPVNQLVGYMQESILPEFGNCVDNGVQYKENATYIEQSMNEFAEMTEELRRAVNEITSSIGIITCAIDEGADGVGGAAESTQNLVKDVEKINSQMEENEGIAVLLKQGADVFKKF